MTFGPSHYVPVLKLSLAEKAALSLLSSRIAAHMTPFLEIVEIPKPTGSGQPRSLAEHVRISLKELEEVVRGFKRCFLDAKEIAASGPTGAHQVFAGAMQLGVRFTPVTGLSRNMDVSAALAHPQDGIALRLTRAEFESGIVRKKLAAFPDVHGLAPAQVDLIIDMGDVSQMIPVGVANMARGFLTDVASPKAWRTLSLVGCAFPKSMGVVVSDSHKSVERSEWLAWRDILYADRNKLIRMPTFGDRSIQPPERIEGLDFRKIQYAAAIRYTEDKEWLLIKGHSKSITPLAAQLPVLARKLVSGSLKGHFAGVSHCQGCVGAAQAAAGAPRFGSLGVWRRLGTVHHITNTVSQIRTLSWP